MVFRKKKEADPVRMKIPQPSEMEGLGDMDEELEEQLSTMPELPKSNPMMEAARQPKEEAAQPEKVVTITENRMIIAQNDRTHLLLEAIYNVLKEIKG